MQLITPKRCRFCRSISPIYDDVHLIEKDRNGNISLGGRKLNANEVADLKGRVMMFRKSGLWNLLSDNMKRRASEIGLTKATDFDQVLVAKSMLFLISEINGIIRDIESSK